MTAGHEATDALLPITLREPVRGSRWGLEAMEMSGLERIRSAIEHTLPDSPSMRLSGLRPSEVGLGTATFEMPASPWWQLGTGYIPAGTLAFVADAAASGAVLSTVKAWSAITTSGLAIDFLRSVNVQSETIIARGRVTHSTSSLGLAEVFLEDARGRLLAHGTARCVIIDIEPRAGGVRSGSRRDLPPDDGPDPYDCPLEGSVRGAEYWNATSGIERLREVGRERYPSPVMRFTGMRVLDVDDGEIRCGMPASRWLTNYGGTIYGGAIALLAEASASAAALTTLPPDTACAPLDLKVYYVRPVQPSDGEITAHSRVVHRGRTIAIVHSEVSAEGKVVAIANQSLLVLPGRSWDEPVHVADEVASDETRP
jgi:uncharacterized protein (TIGR00369 family)